MADCRLARLDGAGNGDHRTEIHASGSNVDENLDVETGASPRSVLQVQGCDAATYPDGSPVTLDPAARNLLVQMLSLVLSFGLSLTVALVYKRLNRGAPQVRTFPQTLAVSGIVSAIIVLSIGD